MTDHHVLKSAVKSEAPDTKRNSAPAALGPQARALSSMREDIRGGADCARNVSVPIPMATFGVRWERAPEGQAAMRRVSRFMSGELVLLLLPLCGENVDAPAKAPEGITYSPLLRGDERVSRHASADSVCSFSPLSAACAAAGRRLDEGQPLALSGRSHMRGGNHGHEPCPRASLAVDGWLKIEIVGVAQSSPQRMKFIRQCSIGPYLPISLSDC